MTKEIELPSGRYLLTTVPNDCCDIEVSKIDGRQYIVADKGESQGPEYYLGLEPLPKAHTYTLIGKADQLTEDQWKEIVEWHEDSNDSSYDPQYNVTTYFDVFTNYKTGDQGDIDTAKESGLSLLKANGFEIDTTLILKID